MDSVLGGWQISAINTMQAGTPFNITYRPNGAQAVSPQISATYRGANEYRPDRRVRPVPLRRDEDRAANTGYINYVNLNAFQLPPTKAVDGTRAQPVR